MKILLLTLLILSGSVFAQSGVYMDYDRQGEGITVFDWTDLHGVNQITFYFYSYDRDDDQRWFLGSSEWDEDMSKGFLYAAEGVNYPEGIPSGKPFEEDVIIVGEAYKVGTYVLLKGKDGGYALWVTRLDEVEARPTRDFLYDHAFDFFYPILEIK